MSEKEARAWVPRLLAALVFVAYAWLAPPGMYWLDSQELGASGASLGVAHPTGFPLVCLLWRAAALLPFGELAWRIHLVSAISASVCAWTVARLVAELAGDDLTATIAGAGAAIALAASQTFFRSATVTEVYAPTAAFLAIALRLAVRVLRGPVRDELRGRDRSTGLALAFFAGLGATGVHASFRLLLGLPLVAIVLFRLWRGARWPLAALLLVTLGASVALYLPVRSASGHVALLDWGHPRTISALWDHLSAGRIRRAFGAEMFATGGVVASHARRLAELIEGDLGVLVLVASLGGAIALASRRAGAAILLLVVAAGDFAYSIWINPMGIPDRQDGVPFAVAAAILAGVGLAAGARRLGRGAPIVAGALGFIVAVQPVLGSGAEKLALRSDAPRGWSEAALQASPPGAVILVESDSLAAGLLWLTTVEAARPDVAVLVRQHLWDRRRNRSVLSRAGIAGTNPIAGDRPIVWEPGDDAPPEGWGLAPGAPVGRLVRPGESLPPTDVGAVAAMLARVFVPPATDDENGRPTAAKAYLTLAVVASRQGDLRGAAALADAALSLRPDYPVALVDSARFHMAVDEDAVARTRAEIAVRVAPDRADAWALLGILDARAARCDEARTHLDRALALDPDEPDAKRNRAALDSCGK